MYVGSFGKEYTGNDGSIVNTNNNWVKVIDQGGRYCGGLGSCPFSRNLTRPFFFTVCFAVGIPPLTAGSATLIGLITTML